MIWSVSTLLRRSGTPTPVWVVNLSMTLSSVQVGRRRQRAADGGGGGDGHGHQVRAPALALPALEVAVRRGRAPLAGGELVGVHAQTHGAAGATPLGTRLLEDDVEALLLGLEPDPHRAGHDQQAGVLVDVAALDDRGGGAQVLDAA